MGQKTLEWYKRWVGEELNGCIEFWLKNGLDNQNGGVYTCLDREGKLYSTDKSVWMQGRCAWTFANLCTTNGKNRKYMEAAKSCLDFLENHCINHDAKGRLYFTVTAEGEPLRQRRYRFSEAFYTMGNAEYALASGEEEYLLRAKKYYDFIYEIANGMTEDPAGLGSKTFTKTRKTRALADPMIYLNLSAVMRRCDSANSALYDKRALECVDAILRYHHKPELRCTLETVGENGEFLDRISAGREINPGHSIECAWFLMEEANYRNDDELYSKAVEMFDFAMERGWDDQYAGILYFVDALNFPPESYEHDMKLWWPHNEAAIASLMIYKDKGDEEYFKWFERIIDYCDANFSDNEYGEWYGYLRRDGKPTSPPSKGTTFKGPFHLPRMLIMLDIMLRDIGNQQSR